MTTETLLLIAGALALAAVVAGVVFGLRTWRRYRGEMLVTCPETHAPAAVHVDASHAVRGSLKGHGEIRLDQCSRWPDRAGCGQDCLSQIEADPQSCMVWNKVAEWYRGQQCAYCKKPFGDIRWHDQRPAVMDENHKTVQWNEIPAEKLPEVFETHWPVCWSCHIAETFRQEHPDLVTDRPPRHSSM